MDSLGIVFFLHGHRLGRWFIALSRTDFPSKTAHKITKATSGLHWGFRKDSWNSQKTLAPEGELLNHLPAPKRSYRILFRRGMGQRYWCSSSPPRPVERKDAGQQWRHDKGGRTFSLTVAFSTSQSPSSTFHQQTQRGLRNPPGTAKGNPPKENLRAAASRKSEWNGEKG